METLVAVLVLHAMSPRAAANNNLTSARSKIATIVRLQSFVYDFLADQSLEAWYVNLSNVRNQQSSTHIQQRKSTVLADAP